MRKGSVGVIVCDASMVGTYEEEAGRVKAAEDCNDGDTEDDDWLAEDNDGCAVAVLGMDGYEEKSVDWYVGWKG